MAKRLWQIIFYLPLLGLWGCTSSDTGAKSSLSAFSVNLTGVITLSSSSLSFGLKSGTKNFSSMSVVGCIVTAYDLIDNSVAGVAASDLEGKYVINSGLSAAVTYKIVADCGSDGKFSAIGTSDYTNPKLTAQADLIKINPRSSIISAYTLQALTQSYEAALASPTGSGDDIKKIIASKLNTILSAVTVTVEQAIQSGSMQEPTIAQANLVSDSLEEALDSATITQSLSSGGVSTPASVEQAVGGAQSAALVSKECNSALAGASIETCVQSVAKLIYNTLGFSVLIKTSGGAFGTIACDASLNSIFLNASYSTAGLPAGYCKIKPTVGRINRNQGHENQKANNGPLFAETGNLNGIAGDEVGVITELGNALFNKYTYNLGSLDKIVFGKQSSAGMNSRLIYVTTTPAAGMFDYVIQYMNALGIWTGDGWPSVCGAGAKLCSVNETKARFDFATFGDWSSASGETTLASQLDASSNVGLGIFAKVFEGKLPKYADLATKINTANANIRNNNSGEKEFVVLTESDLVQNTSGTLNPCFDNDSSTECLSADGTPLVPIQVTLAMGAKPSTGAYKGFTPISTIEKSSTGNYYLKPVMNQNGFSGIVNFIRVTDGQVLTDDNLNPRTVKIILNTTECDNTADDIIPAGCSLGELYNVSMDWSQCSSNPTLCPKLSLKSSNAIANTGFNLSIRSNYKSKFNPFCNVTTGCTGTELVGFGNQDSITPYKFSVTPGIGDDAFTWTGNGVAAVDGEYNLAIYRVCTSGVCTVNGFYFVNYQGIPYEDSDCTEGAITYGSSSSVGKYGISFIEAIATDWNATLAGNQTLSSVSEVKMVPHGPIANPNFKCSSEPYFIDANSNGNLDCEITSVVINGTTYNSTRAGQGDLTFSNIAEYNRWLNAPGLTAGEKAAREALSLQVRNNGYIYSDPIGTMNLMSLAFNGLLDGYHDLSKSTKLDALQAFTLTYLMLSQEGDLGNYIPGLSPSASEKYDILMAEGLDTLSGINQSLGKSFKQFKIN